jgi:hypothetical protein
MVRLKTGEVITFKEYMRRWKVGIQNITPIQRLTNEARGTLISLIGFIIALIAMVIFRDKFIVSWFAYGLILVFVGSVFTTGLKWLTLRQQMRAFKEMDSMSLKVDVDKWFKEGV